MSTPYPERGNGGQVTPSLTGRPSSPETIEFGPEIITVTRPSGGTDPAIQQQVVELASMVPSFPGCCRRAWMVKRTASPTAGVIPRRDCNERGAGAGRQ